MRVFLLILSLCLLALTGLAAYKSLTIHKERVEKNIYVNNNEPISNLTFEDLVKLSQQADPEEGLKEKINTHLSMAYVVNRNFNNTLDKSYLRIAQWNVKRGTNIETIKTILNSPKSYEISHISNIKRRQQKAFKDELYSLTSSDIICLNEIDIGLPRTGYKNIVSYLANPLNLNYAYATEFIEVGPLFSKQKVKKDLYKGLHGNAIISRFPIISSRVLKFPNYYDWYREEVKMKQSPIEHFRKFGARAIFSEKILPHEVRHGSRQALIADIKLPNNEIITVVSTHLEDRAYPDERLKQFKYLLENIKDIKTPVILAGDFNTSTTDTRPTCFQKEVHKRIRDPHFLLRQAAFIPVPFVPVVGGLAAVAFSKLLQYKDPFFPSIPIIFPNHERKFLSYLKKFKFNDGCSFDLSGDKRKSSNGRRGLLSNSNQRHWKGFKSTFKLEKPRIIAYFKLDWFFIKPIGNHFTPFNGKTLKTLNYSLKGLISDHNPITVDLKL